MKQRPLKRKIKQGGRNSPNQNKRLLSKAREGFMKGIVSSRSERGTVAGQGQRRQLSERYHEQRKYQTVSF